ncbi:ABC-2 type transport system ATP-binding protein [Melghirimyces profundicolus]|uniref:ABC-2 type transport system ATP-binding protein n=1 Tax=Melghirimyces profundicolus TaxID=1242148 RepID=A0A2T6BWI4_9BACL|nr:ATP-binding cassette domain-containing protein [Melghirimyces profundicolus]PTX60317.1 ABC-2 type transport system ATP-binding protein [Melghirimyces profundicolus]
MRIEWSHVNKQYAEGENGPYRLRKRTGLLDFTVTLKEGVTAVLGPKGSGKTTLLRVTATLSVPDDGRITYRTFGGRQYTWSRSIAAMGDTSPLEPLRRRLGYVPPHKKLNQDDVLLEDALVYLAQYHRLSQPKKQAVEMVARWGLAAFRKRTLAELPAAAASRYALAASLIGDPDIWLLDEPTRGLDELGWHLFLRELERRKGKGITLMAIHDLELAEVAENLLLVEGGSCRRLGRRKLLTSGVPDGSVASWYRMMQSFSSQGKTGGS